MADNFVTDPGALGAEFVSREVSHSGDTVQLSGAFIMGISGTEGAYTAVAINGDAANGLDVDVTRVSGTVTVDGSGVTQPISGDVTNAGAFAVQEDGAALTALQLIDNPVFADDAPFTLTTSSVSMAGAIRDDSLSALAAVEGDAVPLRVGSTGALHVTGGGGGTEYNEDDATPSPIVGTATLMERDDVLGGVTPVAGDWVQQFCNANGALWTAIDGDVTAVGAAAENAAVSGNPVLSGGRFDSSARTLGNGDAGAIALNASGHIIADVSASTGGTHTDDSAFTPGVDDGVPVFGMFDDAAPDSVDEGDAGVVRMSANRNLYSTIRDAAGSERGVNVNASNQLAVAGPVTNAGAFVVQEDGAALTALQLIDNPVAVLGTATYSEGSTSGNIAGAVRNDMLAALADTDNEIAPLQVNADGSLYVHSSNKISTNNSTVSTLTSAANFTGTGEDVSQFAVVTIQLDASHDSATDGMTFEFSSDNSNWDDVYTFTYTAADGARRFQFPVTAQYFRINYTNGGTNQTHFRVQTIFHDNTTLTTIHRLVDNTDPDRSAELVKSVLIAQAAGSGDFIPVQATAAGNFKTSLQEISDGLDIGAGNAGSETQRVSISTDDINLAAINAGQLPDGHNVTVDNASLAVTVAAGAATIAKAEDSASADLDVGVPAMARRTATPADTSGADLDYEMLQMDNGRLWTAANATLDAETTKIIGSVIPVAAATGGMSFDMLALAAEDNDKVIKASAGTLYYISVQSIDATPVYLKLFDATSITPGTTVADLQFMCPANATAALGAGIVLSFSGIEFATGIVALIATGIALDDNTAVSANEVVVTLGFE